MKLVVAVTALVSIATSTVAFDVDLELHEVEQLRGKYLISDLTVGTKARVQLPFCQDEGRLFIFDTTAIYPMGDFVVTLKPNGHFSSEFSPLDYKGEPQEELMDMFRPPVFPACQLMRLSGFSGNLMEVDDVDGYTTYSEWARDVLQRFPLDD